MVFAFAGDSTMTNTLWPLLLDVARLRAGFFEVFATIPIPLFNTYRQIA
jgi:hypothetical protein